MHWGGPGRDDAPGPDPFARSGASTVATTSSTSSTSSTTSSMFSVSGISSGIDTDAMVTALMNVERHPQDALKAKKATYDAMQAAWSAIATRMAAVRTAASNLRYQSTFDGFATATSTNPDAVTATATTGG